MLEGTLTNLTSEVSSRLTLATGHHIGIHRLPLILSTFTQEFPKVALNIQFLDSKMAYEEVLWGRAEVAVTTLAPNTTVWCVQLQRLMTNWSSR